MFVAKGAVFDVVSYLFFYPGSTAVAYILDAMLAPLLRLLYLPVTLNEHR